MGHLLASLDGLLPGQQALWGVPLLLTIHNLEEAMGVHTLVYQLAHLFPWFKLSAHQFLVALGVVTLGVWCVALFAAPSDRMAILLSVQAILFLNVFVPHLLLSVRLRRYTPGVASALLLNLPFSLYLVHWLTA